MADVQRIEADGRFVSERSGRTPTVDARPVVLEGDVLKALLASARCREGSVLWKGGIAATLVMADGSRVRVDGFSAYGGFLRVHRNQWCELDGEAWRRAWAEGSSLAPGRDR